MKYENDNPDYLEGLGDLLPAEVLKKLNELLEQQHQSNNNHQGSIVLNIYEKGSQHVDHVDNQYFYREAVPNPPQKGREKESETKEAFNADTPLSALFRESHHDELRKIIDSWRPYLVDDDPSTDALALTNFEFDKKRIYSNRVYYDLLDLDALGALQVSLSDLARYLGDHTNLSSSYATLYRLLKKYRQERG